MNTLSDSVRNLPLQLSLKGLTSNRASKSNCRLACSVQFMVHGLIIASSQILLQDVSICSEHSGTGSNTVVQLKSYIAKNVSRISLIAITANYREMRSAYCNVTTHFLNHVDIRAETILHWNQTMSFIQNNFIYLRQISKRHYYILVSCQFVSKRRNMFAFQTQHSSFELHHSFEFKYNENKSKLAKKNFKKLLSNKNIIIKFTSLNITTLSLVDRIIYHLYTFLCIVFRVELKMIKAFAAVQFLSKKKKHLCVQKSM